MFAATRRTRTRDVVAALVVLVIGGLAANALFGVVRACTSRAGDNPDLLAPIARVTVWAFAIVVAVNQIGVAETLVNTLFMPVVGRSRWLAVGGREVAADMLDLARLAREHLAPGEARELRDSEGPVISDLQQEPIAARLGGAEQEVRVNF